jgi:hypothetical protein
MKKKPNQNVSQSQAVAQPNKLWAMWSTNLSNTQANATGDYVLNFGVTSEGDVAVYNLAVEAPSAEAAKHAVSTTVDTMPVELTERLGDMSSNDALKGFRVEGYKKVAQEAKAWGADNVRSYLEILPPRERKRDQLTP